jgi:hypothetical protein
MLFYPKLSVSGKAVIGQLVTATCAITPWSWLMTTKTYRTLKKIVGTVQKSIAQMPLPVMGQERSSMTATTFHLGVFGWLQDTWQWYLGRVRRLSQG